jgi:nucleotide-binding universal stress UspA family protein
MSTVFQRLLLATEHTDFDAGAERLAMELARRCGLPLSAVLPLVSNPEFEALAPEIAARAEQDAATKMTQLRELAQASGVALEVRARRGQEPYQEIVDEARSRASDLIVIRRRGKRGFLANLLLGEMVAKVVAHAPCNVLIVPRDAGMWQRRVLVAVEPTSRGGQIVKRAAAVAADCALPLSIVSVIQHEDPTLRCQADAFLEAAMQGLRPTGLSMQGRTLVGRPHQEILETVQREGADLLVIGSRNDSHIKRALIGGVAQKAIGLAECPVLVIQVATQEQVTP